MKEKNKTNKELDKFKKNYIQNKNKQEKIQLQNIEKNAKNIQNESKNVVKNNNSYKKNNKIKTNNKQKKNNINLIENKSLSKKSIKSKNNIIREKEKNTTIKKRKSLRLKKVTKLILIFISVLILLSLIFYLIYLNKEEEKERIRLENIKKEESLIKEINNHYNEYVKANKEAIIYNEKEEEVGKIANNIELSLEETTIDKNTKYFKIKDFEDNYIKYEDVDIIDTLSQLDSRYKNYIVFNQNIETNDLTTFYDQDNNLVYQFNKSFDLPIIIKDNERYGVEFNNKLLYVKKEDVINIKDIENTTLEKASSIRVIAYHAFYDKNIESESWCRSSICHPIEQIEEHSKYISENSYFTLTMNELEMYIDGKINVPKKSVVITIDDGLLAEHGLDILTKYKLNATLFLVTSYYKPSNFIDNEYIEYHSHGHNIHNVGECPGGQGGGIKCLEENLLQEDLKTSREILNGSTVFCYPFYEYNDYSIRMLKQAGFTMAFAGLINDGKVHVGTNKYLIPRYTITSDVSPSELANIIK